MNKPLRLKIRDFAQINELSLKFGDLTVLVGAQGTGKSVALQWLKAAMDGKHLINSLREAGQEATSPESIIDLIFGLGMGQAWNVNNSRVTFNGQNINPSTLSKRGTEQPRAFYIPAQRASLISDGWAMPFQRLNADTPVVARIFSQTLFERFSGKGGDDLFPVPKLLKEEYRKAIDNAVFHGGTIALDQDNTSTKRMKLRYGETQLPYMTWTAGQREFTPLLLGLYHLLPRTNASKHTHIEWVIVEEPEMGLHPQAQTAFLLLVLDLLWRGYRVVISTHSSHLLTAVWMLQRLRQFKARWQLLCEALDLPSTQAMRAVAETALAKSYFVHFLEFASDSRVISQDISSLDPDSENPGESDWGGLTGFSNRFGDAVRKAVNESAR